MTHAQTLLQGLTAGLNAVLQSVMDELERGQQAVGAVNRLQAENTSLVAENANLQAEIAELRQRTECTLEVAEAEGEPAPPLEEITTDLPGGGVAG